MPTVPTLHVVPLVTTRALAGPLDYLGPDGDEPLAIGTIVRAPLGARVVDGVVVGAGEADSEGLRAVEATTGPGVPPDLVELALWIGAYYGSTPARALALVLPPRVAPASETWVEPLPHDGKLHAARRAVLAALAGGPRRLAELQDETGATRPLLRRMAQDGQVRLQARPIAPTAEARDRAPLPTEEQAAAIARIDVALQDGGALLVHGVTGSGKTEVYLHAIAATLDRGLAAIVLVPEIALAPQTAGRITARFGARVAVLHSGLADGVRAAAYARIRSGDADVVVGPRSAVLAPVGRLGLVVVDEEHDAAYKQGDDPRYDARRVALRRARSAGALLLACSATPRPESWHGLERVTLRSRVGGALPPVEVVDLRGDPHYPLSRPLRDGLGALADEGGRAILLLNRRGAAPALHCRACGRGFRCPNCDVSLTLYAGGGSAAITAGTPSACLAPVRPAEPSTSCGSARAPSASSRRWWTRAGPALRSCASTPTPRRRAARWRTCSSASHASPGPCSSGRRWWPRGTTCEASGSRRPSTPTRACSSPTSAARSARSPC